MSTPVVVNMGRTNGSPPYPPPSHMYICTYFAGQDDFSLLLSLGDDFSLLLSCDGDFPPHVVFG